MTAKDAKPIQQTNASKKRCFVIGPIGNVESETRRNANNLFLGLIKPAIETFGSEFELIRADQITDPGSITEQVITAVIDADLVIADLSEHNPNAFYELGIRHAVQKPVIHVIGVNDEIPFDTKDYRTIRFNPLSIEGMQAVQNDLRAQIKAIFQDGYKVSNPITLALGTKDVRLSGDPKDKIVSDLAEEVRSLSLRLEEIETTSERSRGLRRMDEQLRAVESTLFGRATVSSGPTTELKKKLLIDALMGKSSSAD